MRAKNDKASKQEGAKMPKIGMKKALKKVEGSKADKAQDMKMAKKLMKKPSKKK